MHSIYSDIGGRFKVTWNMEQVPSEKGNALQIFAHLWSRAPLLQNLQAPMLQQFLPWFYIKLQPRTHGNSIVLFHFQSVSGTQKSTCKLRNGTIAYRISFQLTQGFSRSILHLLPQFTPLFPATTISTNALTVKIVLLHFGAAMHLLHCLKNGLDRHGWKGMEWLSVITFVVSLFCFCCTSTVCHGNVPSGGSP